VQTVLCNNPAVTSHLTIESNPGVIEAILVNYNAPFTVHQGDFFTFAAHEGASFDTFLTDFAPVNTEDSEYATLRERLLSLRRLYPSALHLHHGYQRLFDVFHFERMSGRRFP